MSELKTNEMGKYFSKLRNNSTPSVSTETKEQQTENYHLFLDKKLDDIMKTLTELREQIDIRMDTILTKLTPPVFFPLSPQDTYNINDEKDTDSITGSVCVPTNYDYAKKNLVFINTYPELDK